MITKAINKAFITAFERKWDKIYWAVDIHSTILVPTYEKGISTEFYPLAKETLQMASKRKDIDLILYTCSWPHEIEQYIKMFEKNDIFFKNANKNSEIKNSDYGYYNDKPYFNVLFEDKAGFDPKEWFDVIELLKEFPENYLLDNCKK